MTRQVLPTNVRPTHYAITLTPDLVNFTFSGHEDIKIKVNEATNKIVLNARNLKVTSAKLIKAEHSQECADISYDNINYEVTLTFAQELPTGYTADLRLEFTGVLSNEMCGFYKSSYTDGNGNTRYMATTQFEPTDARRAFPCWDEPAIKATFDITLIVSADLVALSNTNVIAENPYPDGRKQVKFATTPIMSTYLIAFVIADLKYIEGSSTGEHNGHAVPMRVYAIKGFEEQGRHALNVAVQALEYFAQIFGIAYPLPKLDMVAVPDFEAGAMENWGLVTYRTAAILFDPKASDARFKQRIAYTVSHELAHQWFGNLVTMEWWDHLWLNEGFATWVGYLAVDKIFPEWDIWTQYISESMSRGLQLDALRSSHPIEVPVNNPSEIHQIFDFISYHKGAAVIRMLSAYIGVDTFLKGVRRYLKRHEYANASTDDLWKALSEESGTDVGHFMSGWTRKIGYPVLTVTEPAPNKIRVRQTRFLSSGDVKPEEDDMIWWVPLGIITGSNTPAECSNAVLTDKETDFSLPEGADFFKLNARQTGVFRVNYTPERLTKLGKAVKTGGLLDTIDRVGLVTDAAALASSGYAKTSGFLNLIREFENEDQYLVWLEIDKCLSELIVVWYEQPEAVYQGLLSFRRHLVGKLAHKLGWEYPEGENHHTSMLRMLAINAAGKAGDPQVVAEARRRFKLYVEQKDESALHPNLRGAVFEIVLTHGGRDEYNAVVEQYRTCQTADQKTIILTALGCVQQPELIESALDLTISDEVRSQDIIWPFRGFQLNRNARKPLWQFVKKNWKLLEERYSMSLTLLCHVVKLSTEYLASESDAADIEAFFHGKDTKEVNRYIQQGLDNVRANAAWLARDSADVQQWMMTNGYIKS